MHDENIIKKVQKLLALATSDNENESQVAAQKAQELIAKYNIDQQLLNSKLEYQWEVLIEEPYFKLHQKFIWPILKEYFFVRTLLSYVPTGEYTAAGQRKTKVQLKILGTPTNIIIADYIFHYLCETYQRLFLEHKRTNSLGERARQPYYAGMSKAIKEKLEEARLSAQESMASKVMAERSISHVDAMALVVIKNDLALDEEFKKIKTSTHKSSGWSSDEGATEAGYQAGKNVNLARPIDHKNDAPVLGIGYKKK